MSGSTILAHVSGPVAVGKTTLMYRIRKDIPHVAVVDLDRLDDYGIRKLNLPADWRIRSYSDESLTRLHAVRQCALDRLVSRCSRRGRALIIFGIHIERWTEYEIATHRRIVLVRTVWDIVEDRIRRLHKLRETQEPRSDECKVAGLFGSSGLRDLAVKSLRKRYQEETEGVLARLREDGYVDLCIEEAYQLLISIS